MPALGEANTGLRIERKSVKMSEKASFPVNDLDCIGFRVIWRLGIELCCRCCRCKCLAVNNDGKQRTSSLLLYSSTVRLLVRLRSKGYSIQSPTH